jgi:hypothetical protein
MTKLSLAFLAGTVLTTIAVVLNGGHVLGFAILGFLVPAHHHAPNHAICSALITLALRAKGCEWFPFPLASPAHLVNPRDLLLILSAQMRIPGI